MYTEREEREKEKNRRMEIHTWHETKNPEWWLKKIGQCDWIGGQYLHRLLSENRFRELFGENAEVLLLTDGTNLASFCTYAAKDDIPDTDRTPWIGFVFTCPAYRGHRYAGLLLDHARRCAERAGATRVYLATDHTGLYEKYGFSYLENRPDIHGEDARIYTAPTPE